MNSKACDSSAKAKYITMQVKKILQTDKSVFRGNVPAGCQIEIKRSFILALLWVICMELE